MKRTRRVKRVALIWFVVALILLAILLLVWSACMMAGIADEAQDALWAPAEATAFPQISPPAVTRYVYPGVPLEDSMIASIEDICAAYGVSVPLVLAMIARESDFDPGHVGDGGHSLGLMQVQPVWHRERMARLGVLDLLDAYDNVLVGVDFLAELLDRGYGEEWAVMCYNGGEVHANYYINRGEMSHYCADVMRMRDCIAEAALVEVVT